MHRYSFTKRLAYDPDHVLGYAQQLRFSTEEAATLPVREDGARRYSCWIEEFGPWPVALNPIKGGGYYIMLNKARIKLLQKAGHDLTELSIQLQLDTSKYGMPTPPEMEELLHSDPQFQEYFDALTPGRQRNLLHLVAKPKGEAARLTKAVGIAEYLVSVRGQLDMQELQAWLKENAHRQF